MDRIVFESIGFFSPGFTDGFERREPIQSLEMLGEVVTTTATTSFANTCKYSSTPRPARSSKDDLALSADAQSRALGRANRTYGFATSQSDLNGSLADHRTGCRCR